MYIFLHNPSEGLAVWVIQDATSSEWDTHFEHLRDVANWSGKNGKRAALLLVNRGSSRPDARRRVELVRLTDAAGYDPYVAFVTPSIALRAALALYGWIQKAPKYKMNSFDSSKDALAWLKKMRSDDLETLETMFADARAAYGKETGNELP